MKFLSNSRERALFLLFVALAVLLVLCIGGSHLLAREAFLQNELFRLRTESLNQKGWIADGKDIQARQDWLDGHLPASGDLRKDGLDFLEEIEKQARAGGLQITEKSILDPENTSDWTAVPVRVSVEGQFHDLVLLLYGVQQPGNFVILREVTIKAGSDVDKIASDLEFLKVFRTASQGGAGK